MDNARSTLEEALAALTEEERFDADGRARQEVLRQNVRAAARELGRDAALQVLNDVESDLERRPNINHREHHQQYLILLELADARQHAWWPWDSAAAKADAEQPNDAAMDNGPPAAPAAGGRRSRRNRVSRTRRAIRRRRMTRRSRVFRG